MTISRAPGKLDYKARAAGAILSVDNVAAETEQPCFCEIQPDPMTICFAAFRNFSEKLRQNMLRYSRAVISHSTDKFVLCGPYIDLNPAWINCIVILNAADRF